MKEKLEGRGGCARLGIPSKTYDLYHHDHGDEDFKIQIQNVVYFNNPIFQNIQKHMLKHNEEACC